MNFEAVTIKDIASELGISPSAVSRALNGSYDISAKTQKLVKECALKHNYQPNRMAQSLKHGFSKSIGIVVPTIDNSFFSQVINGIESVAYSKGYNVIITQTHERYELEVLNLSHLILRAVDGLLVSLTTETQDIGHLKTLNDKGLPIVFFDRICKEINTHKVIVDNFTGAYKATSHLINEGFRKIAHITSSASISITGERLKGYQQALLDNNIAINDQYIKYCPHGGKDIDEIQNALSELLYSPNKPDAIFTASDRITTATLRFLMELRFHVPNDVGLLGFSNNPLSDLLNPSLTSIYQPGYEMGKKATEMLIALIESRRPVFEFETVTLPTQLFIRNSSKINNGN